MNYTHVVSSDERRTAEELGKILHVNERNIDRSDSEERLLTFRIQ